MGARLARGLRNFNLEQRVAREVGRDKPLAAPTHPTARDLIGDQLRRHPEIREEVTKKDDKLLTLLKGVYVDSHEPGLQRQETTGQTPRGTARNPEVRLPKGNHLNLSEVRNIPKGKISVVEALMILNNHKLHPETWTAKKIAQEYQLELGEVESLLRFFIVFDMEIFSPDGEPRKAIGAK
ncbi:NADH dehydrogenase [ubiquinone] 1 alpha subcomplex assembly factor 4 [Tachyglossus aculeatus]|uniref:NADH dehydrogenase [ubiquinone] 1 alpha subcomplex assembly factor 4 n=1 Tax=Tachyglossus aculeatus TaxID=9261 RepID=UPI0018F33795|nr:NADH dehydrogenase [ubiquinone] 1 alpha subcomplex assembly factor 4 [Tachyglossus aculeatus]